MAKKQPAAVATETEVVEELHVSDDTTEYTDVTGKDDLPEGVADPAADDEADEPAKKPAKPAKAAPVAEDEIPEELRGKTQVQLAKMYRDAQSVIGRQGSELGELRSTADRYIRANLDAAARKAAAPKPAEPDVKAPDAVDFFTNPTESVAKLIENHPALKDLKGQAQEFATREIQRRREDSTRQFNAAHPDAAEILADPDFREWVTKSALRKAMLLRAHQHYDLASANEVFSTYKELKAARTAAQPVVDGKSGAKPAVKPAGKEAARVPTGGNAAPRVPAGGKEGKIFRRADVIRLMEQDPDRYQLMADEITKAYQEGRVR